MGSSGKKKTTMAKLARESRLRERRQTKQAKKDARKLAPSGPEEDQAGSAGDGYDVVHAIGHAGPEPVDPRAKEVALDRLRDAPDEQLAVFEGELQASALQAGASEQEMRDAQRHHPGHNG